MNSYAKLPLLIALAVAASACGDDRPTAPASTPEVQRRDKAAERAALLTDVAVSGPLSNGTSTAGSFAGRFSAKRFDIDPVTRQLTVTGVLSGTATLIDGGVVQVTHLPFTTTAELSSSRKDLSSARPVSDAGCETSNRPATVTPVNFRPVQASCDVLFLDLGPISLDLLGLTVDLSRVVLDVNAVPGRGNLLGNLLCALLGLLDVTALLSIVTQILESINDILAGLNPGGAIGASFERGAMPVGGISHSA